MSCVARSLSAAALFLALGAGPALADVRVTFDHPERFTDASLRGNRGPSASTLTTIDTYIRQLAAKWLAPGQTLDLAVLDIDLAGEYEWWRVNAMDTRFLRSATWPKMKVRYTLTVGGATSTPVEETISDMNYLMRVNAFSQSDPLRYEKTMLEDWFRARFGRGDLPRS